MKPTLLKPVLLTGFMGCGKSYAAKNIFNKLFGFKVVSIDGEIKKLCSLEINEIFKKYGEKTFRKYESIALKAALSGFKSSSRNLVIDAGGGLCLQRQNRLLLRACHVIFINTPYNIVKQRLKGDCSRPLIKGEPNKKIYCLLKKRLPIYTELADYTAKNTNELIIFIKKLLGETKNASRR